MVCVQESDSFGEVGIFLQGLYEETTVYKREEGAKEMPVLESTDDRIVPKSIIPQRQVSNKRTTAGKRTTGGSASPPVQRASRLPSRPIEKDAVEIEEWERVSDDEEVETRPPVRKSSTTAPPKSLPKTPPPRPVRTSWLGRGRAHPLLYLGLGMLFMLILWTLVMGVAGWAGNTLDTLRYGYPRTYQVDQFVGHNEANGIASHFIAINLHGRIEIIEFPGGDASHAHVYEGPQLYTTNADLVPVTLKFEDLNGDHQPDMLVCFQGSQIVYINSNGQFAALQESERTQVEQALQRPGMSC